MAIKPTSLLTLRWKLRQAMAERLSAEMSD
jgi:hypothetical protein